MSPSYLRISCAWKLPLEGRPTTTSWGVCECVVYFTQAVSQGVILLFPTPFSWPKYPGFFLLTIFLGIYFLRSLSLLDSCGLLVLNKLTRFPIGSDFLEEVCGFRPHDKQVTLPSSDHKPTAIRKPILHCQVASTCFSILSWNKFVSLCILTIREAIKVRGKVSNIWPNVC